MRARAETPLAAWCSTAPDDAAVGQSLGSWVLYAESFVVRGRSPFRDAMLDHGEPMLLDPATGPRTDGEIAVDVQQERKRFAAGAARQQLRSAERNGRIICSDGAGPTLLSDSGRRSR